MDIRKLQGRSASDTFILPAGNPSSKVEIGK